MQPRVGTEVKNTCIVYIITSICFKCINSTYFFPPNTFGKQPELWQPALHLCCLKKKAFQAYWSFSFGSSVHPNPDTQCVGRATGLSWNLCWLVSMSVGQHVLSPVRWLCPCGTLGLGLWCWCLHSWWVSCKSPGSCAGSTDTMLDMGLSGREYRSFKHLCALEKWHSCAGHFYSPKCLWNICYSYNLLHLEPLI